MPFKDLHKIDPLVVRIRTWASVKESLDERIADVPSDFVAAYKKMDEQGLAKHLKSMPEANHAAVTAEYRLIKDRQYMGALESFGMLNVPEINAETISAQYRKLTAKLDPAKRKTSPNTEALYKRLQDSWQILGGGDEKAMASLLETSTGLKEYTARTAQLEGALQEYFKQHAASGGWRDKRLSTSKGAEVAANPSFPLDHLSAEQEKTLLASLKEEFKDSGATIAVGSSKTTGLRSVYVIPTKGEVLAGGEIAARLDARMATPAKELAAVRSIENEAVSAAEHSGGRIAKYAIMAAAAVAGAALAFSYLRKKPQEVAKAPAGPTPQMQKNTYNTGDYVVGDAGRPWAAQVQDSRLPGERQL